APPGTETFKNVLGQVEINSRNYDCLITRTDTEMFMTVGLSDGSSYKVYLATDYRGSEQSTYIVTGVERTHYIYSSQYLTNYFMYYYYYGAAAAQSYANNYGTIEIVDKYDEAGEVVESYAEGKFGTAAQYFDSKGNPLTFKAAYELREKINPDTDLYIVAFDGEDGFKYKAYFIVGNHPYMNRPAYIMTYFGREETVTADGGEYEVTVERIVASDVNNPRGALSDFSIRKSGTPVTGGAAALVNGVLYYIVRTDEGATYYFIDVRYESAGEIGEGDDLLEIVGAKVTVKTAVTYEQKDGDGYVDFVDGKLTILSVNTSDGKKNYIVLDYEYDEATSTYTVTIGETVYTVRIEDGKAVITSNAPPKEDEEKPKQ
ncbi:MAG: hypothetical protein ILP02_00015, partial [Clostridia bacterium]|nr:hypothetical protein [Clostridia bacterium]